MTSYLNSYTTSAVRPVNNSYLKSLPGGLFTRLVGMKRLRPIMSILAPCVQSCGDCRTRSACRFLLEQTSG